MVHRLGLAALFLALAAPSWAAGEAYRDARAVAGGQLGVYDGGCTGGSCGVPVSACRDEACRINRTAAGAMRTDGLVTAKSGDPVPTLVAEVPAPDLNPDGPNAKDKPGFFSNVWKSKGLLYGLGTAAAGAGIGWLVGGPAGALIGGLIGAVAGFFLSRMLSK